MTTTQLQLSTPLDETFIYRPFPPELTFELYNQNVNLYFPLKSENPEQPDAWGLYPLGFENANDYLLRIKMGSAWKLGDNPIRLLISPYTSFNDKRYQGRITLHIRPRKELRPTTEEYYEDLPRQFVHAVTGELMSNSYYGHGVPGFPLYSRAYKNKADFISVLNEYIPMITSRSEELVLEAALCGY
jgi:hypothetical protein